MKARSKMAALMLAMVMTVGCGQGSSEPQGKAIPGEFRSSLLQFLDVIGELNALTEAGVTQRDFYSAYAKTKPKADLVFAQWPTGFEFAAMVEMKAAMDGYELAKELWGYGDDIVPPWSGLPDRLKKYGVTGSYHPSIALPEIFARAGRHYNKGRAPLMAAVRADSR